MRLTNGCDVIEVSQVIFLSSLCIIYLGQLIDWYSYFIKIKFITTKSSSFLSVANWVQYTGRMANMIGVFLLSFQFESGLLIENIKYGFIGVFLIVAIQILIGMHFNGCAFFPYLIQRSACLNLFDTKGKLFYWEKLRPLKINILLIISFVTQMALASALIAPFIAASIDPTYRMTFVYLGQFLNFAGSILVFTYIDRSIYRDKSTEEKTLAEVSSIIWGKVISSFCIALIIWSIA